MSKGKLVVALALAAAHLSCGDAPVTAPAGSSLQLIANPPFIVANGGVSVVSAIVVEPVGTFVPDGTEVFFFSDLGQIEASRQTKNGVARVNFVADSRSGTATITAVSGGAAADAEGGGTGTDTVEVAIGSALPTTMLLTANPSGMRSTSSSSITANVFDTNGNPVANVPVIFEVFTQSGNATTGSSEYLESGGGQIFTNTNGQAFDTLRSRRPLSESAEVTVRGTTANSVTDTADVSIN